MFIPQIGRKTTGLEGGTLSSLNGHNGTHQRAAFDKIDLISLYQNIMVSSGVGKMKNAQWLRIFWMAKFFAIDRYCALDKFSKRHRKILSGPHFGPWLQTENTIETCHPI